MGLIGHLPTPPHDSAHAPPDPPLSRRGRVRAWQAQAAGAAVREEDEAVRLDLDDLGGEVFFAVPRGALAILGRDWPATRSALWDEERVVVAAEPAAGRYFTRLRAGVPDRLERGRQEGHADGDRRERDRVA